MLTTTRVWHDFLRISEEARVKRRPIHLERLRAAREASGLSWHQLAKRAGISPPTLTRLERARVKAVNAATLQQLAAVLRVPAAWLIGEQDDLPYVPERDVNREKGEGASYGERPMADTIAWSWLMQRIDNAVRRDLREWYEESVARDCYEIWGRFILAAFNELANFLSWRTAYLVSPVGSWVPLQPSSDSPALDWLTQLLEPWLNGRAYLNADAVHTLFDVLCENPERLWGWRTREAEGRRALRGYARACARYVDRATARRLETDLGPEPTEQGALRTFSVRTRGPVWPDEP